MPLFKDILYTKGLVKVVFETDSIWVLAQDVVSFYYVEDLGVRLSFSRMLSVTSFLYEVRKASDSTTMCRVGRSKKTVGVEIFVLVIPRQANFCSLSRFRVAVLLLVGKRMPVWFLKRLVLSFRSSSYTLNSFWWGFLFLVKGITEVLPRFIGRPSFMHYLSTVFRACDITFDTIMSNVLPLRTVTSSADPCPYTRISLSIYLGTARRISTDCFVESTEVV